MQEEQRLKASICKAKFAVKTQQQNQVKLLEASNVKPCLFLRKELTSSWKNILRQKCVQERNGDFLCFRTQF